jgi:hypothetical protein
LLGIIVGSGSSGIVSQPISRLELSAIEPNASDAPVARGELEIAVSPPVRKHAEHVMQIDLGVGEDPYQVSFRR